jgi:hypothetical protein
VRAKKEENLVWKNNFYDLKQMCDENGKRISSSFSPYPAVDDATLIQHP